MYIIVYTYYNNIVYNIMYAITYKKDGAHRCIVFANGPEQSGPVKCFVFKIVTLSNRWLMAVNIPGKRYIILNCIITLEEILF